MESLPYMRDIDTPHGRVRVTVDRDDIVINPREEWEGASELDVTMYHDDDWDFVHVTVAQLFMHDACGREHECASGSLDMVFFGSGDGWTVAIDDLIKAHPVPDMIAELFRGK